MITEAVEQDAEAIVAVELGVAPQLGGQDPRRFAVVEDGALKAQEASVDAGRPTSTPSSATTAADKFMLTNIEGNSIGATKPNATTPGPTTPSTSPSASGNQYVLTADAGVNLAAHVNHRWASPASSARWATIR
jgi:hypothetical protein